MAEAVGAVHVDLLVEIDRFKRDFKDAQKAVRTFARDARRVGTAMSKNVTTPVLAAGGAMLVAANQAAEYADTIDKTAIRTGIARDTLQELRFTADQTGVSFEGIQGALDGFTRRIPQMEKKGTQANVVLSQLGVSLRGAGGEMRSMQDLFPDIATSLSGVENHTERSALAMQLFGRRAKELIPMLDLGGDGIREMGERARELGLVMEDDGIRSLVAYKDELNAVKQQFGAATREITLGFLPILKDDLIPFVRDSAIPALKDVAKWVRELDPATAKSAAKLALMAAAIGPVVLGISGLSFAVSGIIGAITSLGILLTPAGPVLAGLALLAGAFVKAQVEAVKAGVEVARFTADMRDMANGMDLAQVEREMDDMNQAIAAAIERERELKQEMEEAVRISPTGTRIGPDKSLREEWERQKTLLSELRIGAEQLQGRLRDLRREAADLAGQNEGGSDAPEWMEAAKEASEQLTDSLRQAADMRELLGDGFDEAAAQASAYESAVQAMVKAGVPLDAQVGQQGETLRELAAMYGMMGGELERAAREQKELDLLMREAEGIIAGVMTPVEQYDATIASLSDHLRAGRISQEDFNRAAEQAEGVLEDATKAAKDASDTMAEFTKAALDSFLRFTIEGAKGWSEFFNRIMKDLAVLIARMAVIEGLKSIFPSLGGGVGFAGKLGAALGIRHSGGPVEAGRAYRVRPDEEVFIPRQSGRVEPIGNVQGAGAQVQMIDPSTLPPIPAEIPPDQLAIHSYYRKLFAAQKAVHIGDGGRFDE